MFFVWVKTLLKRSNANICSCFHISSRTTEKIAFFIFYYLVCFKICGNVGDKINIYHKDYALNNWRKRWVSEAYMHSPKHSLKQDVLQLIPWGISWGIPHFLSPVPPIPIQGFIQVRPKQIMMVILKLVSAIFLYFTKRMYLKNYGKCFLFHLMSSFRSRNIQVFVIFFLSFHIFQIQRDRWNWNNYDVWNGLHKLANSIFGTTKKALCIKSSKLPRW